MALPITSGTLNTPQMSDSEKNGLPAERPAMKEAKRLTAPQAEKAGSRRILTLITAAAINAMAVIGCVGPQKKTPASILPSFDPVSDCSILSSKINSVTRDEVKGEAELNCDDVGLAHASGVCHEPVFSDDERLAGCNGGLDITVETPAGDVFRKRVQPFRLD